MNVAIIDNYDSFTHNIAHIVRNHPSVNLQIIIAEEVNLNHIARFEKIIFSPGPDLPVNGNIMEKILKQYGGLRSILGICLGMQAIVKYFGGNLVQLENVVHGRIKTITKTEVNSGLFTGLPSSFEAGFYHSWIADRNGFPECLKITALSDEMRIMAVKHRDHDIEGVQFHPESFMTSFGCKMITNWLQS
ncbi:MAG TPA: aminodeoxychorismate/anthranilate synthase component II [Bacteroidales bacterium]|nr:aminodeoxychorismate/anthranilate synthase component II [Bacteroidales bacterium]